MCLGQSLVEFDRFFGGGSGLWNGVLRSGSVKDGEQRVRVGQSGITNGVIRIFGDRLVEVFDRLAQIGARAFIPKKSALEIELVSIWIQGWHFRDQALLRARELCLQGFSDRLRDFTLD